MQFAYWLEYSLKYEGRADFDLCGTRLSMGEPHSFQLNFSRSSAATEKRICLPEPNLLILLQSQNSDHPSTAIIVEMHLELTRKSRQQDLLPRKISWNQRPYFQKTRQYVAPSHGSGSFRPPARESSSLFRQIAICNQAGCGESRATSRKRDNQTWKELVKLVLKWCKEEELGRELASQSEMKGIALPGCFQPVVLQAGGQMERRIMICSLHRSLNCS